MDKEFAQLIEANRNMIYSVINEWIPTEWHDDMKQEIILQAWRSYKSFRGEAKFSTWLYKVALNCCIDWRRADRVRKRGFAEYAYQQSIPEETPLDWQAIASKVFPLIDGADYDLLHLKYVRGIKVRTLATIFNTTTNAMGLRILRARQQVAMSVKNKYL